MYTNSVAWRTVHRKTGGVSIARIVVEVPEEVAASLEKEPLLRFAVVDAVKLAKILQTINEKESM